MKRLGLLFFLHAFIISCADDRPIADAEIIDREAFKDVLAANSDRVQVINFWATWCAPCIEELPAFESIGAEYSDDVDIILISLDGVEKLGSAVQPFLKKNKIRSQVKLLDDPYAAEWIPLVDPHWDGAIPVTLIKSKNKSRFYNQTFTEAELEQEIKTYL